MLQKIFFEMTKKQTIIYYKNIIIKNWLTVTDFLEELFVLLSLLFKPIHVSVISAAKDSTVDLTSKLSLIKTCLF